MMYNDLMENRSKVSRGAIQGHRSLRALLVAVMLHKRDSLKFGKRRLSLSFLSMLVITLLYGVVAFINLGNMIAPQTFAELKDWEIVTLDLGESQRVTRVALYVGRVEGKFGIRGSTDGQEWVDIAVARRGATRLSRQYADAVEDEDGGLQKVVNTVEFNVVIEEDRWAAFVWRFASVNADDIKYLQIIGVGTNAHILPAIGTVGEVAVFDGDRQIPIVWASRAELADEQDKITHAYRSFMGSTYFDEVYHARAAYEIANRLPVSETTHPPLGQVIKSLGIRFFGMTPFGWRFMGTLSGVLMLPVMFFLAKKVLKNEWVAVVATAIFALDFMHFTLTRIATIDSYPVLFIMLAFLFLWSYVQRFGDSRASSWRRMSPLLLSGVAFGLGVATKWIVLYAAFGILLLILMTWWKVLRKMKVRHAGWKDALRKMRMKLLVDVGACALCFIAIPAAIYIASYLPQTIHRVDSVSEFFAEVVESQRFMFSFHSQLEDAHPFSSMPWSWPFIHRPVLSYLDVDARPQGLTAAMSIIGTPIIWWIGFVALFLVIGLSVARNTKYALIVAVCLALPFLVCLLAPEYSLEDGSMHPSWQLRTLSEGEASMQMTVWYVVFLAMMILCIIAAVKRKTVEAFIAIGFMTHYMFWFLVPRTTFIYHFFASVPFMILAICYWLNKAPKWTRIVILLVAFLLFAAFYPLLAGIRVPIEYAERLDWIESWVIFHG